MNLYEAAKLRYSNRKYLMENIDAKLYNDIVEHINSMFPLFEDVSYSIDIINALEDRKYLTKLVWVNAPYYICIHSTNDKKAFLNAGYILENIAVYLTQKGISSCFMALFKTKLVQKDGMSPVIMLAFGKAKDIPYREDKYAKRLPMEKLVKGYDTAEDVVKGMLECARLAPSGYNAQPLRYVAKEQSIDIFSEKGSKIAMIDVGIAIANMFVVAEEKWQDVHLTLNNINQIYFSGTKYVCTVELNEGKNTI